MVARRNIEVAVLEGKWWDKRNTSLRGVFDLLADLTTDTPHGYYYEMFCDARSLESIMRRVGTWRGLRFVYVGAHGDHSGIYGSLDGHEGKVSRTKLRNALVRLAEQDAGKVDGLFVGSCGFLTAANARHLLCTAEVPITWVAGYSEDVDWIDSTIVDLYFMSQLLEGEGTALQRVNRAATAVGLNMRLAESLGFQVYKRKRGGEDVVPLITWDGD